MRYAGVFLDAIAYELAPVVITSRELEARLRPMYRKFNVSTGQLEALTGIRERRWWTRGHRLSDGAIAAARKALAGSSVPAGAIEMLIYAGVCREHFEPATACRVADALGVHADAAVYDLSNACLGVLNGMINIADRIELGRIRAGMVVSCESAREINDVMIDHMLASNDMNAFRYSLSTLTGGSGAVAVLLTDGSFPGGDGHRLVGGATQTDPRHHGLCRWGLKGGHTLETLTQFMTTDSVNVLKHGIALGKRTWKRFLHALSWTHAHVDKVICHQVGSGHQDAILQTLGIDSGKDFSTYAYLGNMGTVSLPLTAAIAQERGFLMPGDRVGFLGIGSGLNCLMLGLEW